MIPILPRSAREAKRESSPSLPGGWHGGAGQVESTISPSVRDERRPLATSRYSLNPPSVLHMAAPLVVSFWMRAAFAFVDTAYAATLGDAAVGSIGLTAPFEFLMIALWVGLSTGLTSSLSKAMAGNEGGRIQQYLRLTWRLVFLVSPLFALLGVGIWFGAPHLNLEPALARKMSRACAALPLPSSNPKGYAASRRKCDSSRSMYAWSLTICG